MRLKKRFALIAIALSGVVILGACTQQGSKVPTAQQAETQQQNQASDSIINNQPLPHFAWSQLRQNLTEIENAQANTTQTTSFFFNQGVKDPITSCASIGFAIPNTASLSNPQQIVNSWNERGYGTGVVGQMDPNGIYTPTSSSGTYVICIDDTGKPYANYWEGFVETVTGPASWVNGQVKLLGPPTGGFSKGKK